MLVRFYKTNTIFKSLIPKLGIIKLPLWGNTFVGVFTWNVIWTLLATFGAFAFGLLQAVLINSKDTRLKPMWRGLYILPSFETNTMNSVDTKH